MYTIFKLKMHFYNSSFKNNFMKQNYEQSFGRTQFDNTTTISASIQWLSVRMSF